MTQLKTSDEMLADIEATLRDWRKRKMEADAIERRIAEAIDEDRFNDARRALDELQEFAGPDWPELVRLRSLLAFVEEDDGAKELRA